MEFIIGLLLEVLSAPECPTEDSGSCVWVDENIVMINGPMKDQVPDAIVIARR